MHQSFKSDAMEVLAELRFLHTSATWMVLKGPRKKGLWVWEPEAQMKGSPAGNCSSPFSALRACPQARHSVIFFFPEGER